MWFWFALATALLSALSITLNKRTLAHVPAALLTWALFALSIPFLIALVLVQGLPHLSLWFWIGAGGSGTIFVIAKTMATHSIKQTSLSKIVPLTAFGTLFTYVLGVIFLKENIALIPLMGLFMIIFATYILNADQRHESIWKPLTLLFTDRNSFFYLIAMFLSSASGIFDKVGLIHTTPPSPEFVYLIENVFSATLLTSYMTHQDRRWVKDLRIHFWKLLVNCLVYMLMVMTIFRGYLAGPVALVGGVKKLEILFVLILGLLFFNDKPTKHVWIAVLVMLAGVLLVKLN